MGIKERREREKLQLKNAIIDAALSLAAESGWQAVTMRKIAGLIEYSPPTIYEHFNNKDDLLFGIMKKGFIDLHEAMGAAINPESSSTENILRVSDVYWEYSFKNRELYQVMYELGGVAFGTDEVPLEVKEVFYLLKGLISNLPHFHQETDKEITDLADILWGSIHGIVSLTMFNRIAGGEDRGHDLFRKNIIQLLKLGR